MITVEVAKPAQFPTLLEVWESSVRATHFFLREQDIQELRSTLLNEYFPNLNIRVARLCSNGLIVGFTAVSENRIEMLFVNGFVITGRSELDGQGRQYPLLHMKLLKTLSC